LYDEHDEETLPMGNGEQLPVDVRGFDADSRFDGSAWSAFNDELSRGYDLLHTHHNFSGSVARVLASRKDIPVVNTEHRDHSSYSFLQNLVNAPTLPLAEWIVSNSRVTQDSFRWYEQRLLDEDQLAVVHNGVNINRIEDVLSETPDAQSDETVRICTVGRMVPVKNQKSLIRALRPIVELDDDVELVLVGDGPLRGELEALATDLGVFDHVRFTGEISRRRVYEVFRRSDIFAMPSHAEGFCVAAVEAMAAGLPVVASDIPVFHEVIGEPGIFASSEDPEMFAEELSNLVVDEEYREEHGSACRTRARGNFDLNETAKEYRDIYLQVISETSEGRETRAV